MYVDLVIHTKCAPPIFFKHMIRHEIYDVYTRVPIKELFYSNEDANGEFPPSSTKVERFYDDIKNKKLTAILFFDGFDELNGNPVSYFDQSCTLPDDPDASMSATCWVY